MQDDRGEQVRNGTGIPAAASGVARHSGAAVTVGVR